MKLKGKIAIVTGAGSGMGEAIAKLFAAEGAKVVVSDLNKESLERVLADIQSKGSEALGISANVAKQADIDNLVETSLKKFGSIDILINNAGIMDNFKTVAESSDEHWNHVMDVNLNGAFKAARAVIPVMELQKEGGVIVNIASIGGLFGARGGAAYVTSKHGLIGLTKNIASTYGTFGKIRANAIAPGAVETNIAATITEPSKLGGQAIASLGEAPSGKAEDIAKVALFLASEDSRFVNGHVLTADGGWTSK